MSDSDVIKEPDTTSIQESEAVKEGDEDDEEEDEDDEEDYAAEDAADEKLMAQGDAELAAGEGPTGSVDDDLPANKMRRDQVTDVQAGTPQHQP